MSDIAKRLRASVRVDAVNGDDMERSVCARQMTEAAIYIEQLERERETAPTLNPDLAAEIARLTREMGEAQGAWLFVDDGRKEQISDLTAQLEAAKAREAGLREALKLANDGLEAIHGAPPCNTANCSDRQKTGFCTCAEDVALESWQKSKAALAKKSEGV